MSLLWTVEFEKKLKTFRRKTVHHKKPLIPCKSEADCGSFSLHNTSETSVSSPAVCGIVFTRKAQRENYSIKGACRKTDTTSESSRISVGSRLLPVEISVTDFLHGPWITESSHLMWTQSHKAMKATDVL